MGSNNIRSRFGYSGEDYLFKSIVSERKHYKYYFIDHGKLGMSISSYKKSFGLFSTVEDLSVFDIGDVVGYINEVHDIEGIDYDMVLCSDKYLSDSVIEYLNKEIKYDQYGAYYSKSNSNDVRCYTAGMASCSSVDPDSRREFFIGLRLEKMEECSNCLPVPKLSSEPWAFEYKV